MSTDSPKKRGIFRRFFRFLWGSLKALNVIVFGLISLLIVGSILYAVIGQRGLTIPAGTALLINPTGTLVEQQRAVTPAELVQGNELPRQALVKDITDALDAASNDNNIGLVVLQLDKLEQGLMPTLETVAGAITEFKSSGKKVIAIGDNYSQSALYIAAHADEVILNPEGIAVPQGFAMYSPYFKSFLAKHDVTVNLFKVGKYKSAVDPFLRDDMSAEDRTARKDVLDTWWNTYTSDIETARGMTAGTIDQILQNAPEQIRLAGGNPGRLSLDKGFVDQLLSDSERRRYLIDLAGEDTAKKDYRNITYKQYLGAPRLPAKPEGSKVAVITAVGPIVDGDAPAGTIGGHSVGKLIRKARLSSGVEAIVLRIDSGGGSKSASEFIRSELQAAQEAGIPVVASMGSLAASGGYWIASSADEIWASPTTITGSIGIIGLLPSFEKTLARYGIYSDGLSTTPIAGGASAMRGITPEVGEVLQTIIDAGYEQFLSTVSTGRDMDIEAVHEIAQGRIWTGQMASELGLVDELGGLDQAINAAAKLAGVAEYTVWDVLPTLTMEEQLLQLLTETMDSRMPVISKSLVSRITRMIHPELDFLEHLNDPNHVYVICQNCPLQ